MHHLAALTHSLEKEELQKEEFQRKLLENTFFSMRHISTTKHKPVKMIINKIGQL